MLLYVESLISGVTRTPRKKFGLFLVILLLVAGCTPGQKTDVTAVRQAIEAQEQKFAAAYNRQDAPGIAAIYTENARVLPPFNKMIQGRPAIITENKAEFGMGFRDLQLKTVSVDVHGDIAHEIGKYTITLPSPGKEVTKDNGKYLAVWKKQSDGSWLMAIDTWNSSMPPPGM